VTTPYRLPGSAEAALAQVDIESLADGNYRD
jgi:hypothetical protein